MLEVALDQLHLVSDMCEAERGLLPCGSKGLERRHLHLNGQNGGLLGCRDRFGGLTERRIASAPADRRPSYSSRAADSG